VNRTDRPFRRIYAVVARVPRGRVVTYGQVAQLAGLHGQARIVGYALSALPAGTRLPWHRVVNAQGGVSQRANGPYSHVQRARLEKERVRFDGRGRISLERFRWRPGPGRTF
jgi:methylated-DNA-protein-cysteine methyltransferase related protein